VNATGAVDFALPLEKIAAALLALEISLFPKYASPPCAGSQMTVVPESRKRTILLVDDEAIVRSLTARMLEDQGYGIIEATDGVDAWTKLESMAGRIDLVVSDIVMPRLDGIELARCMEIMSHPPPILFMSGYCWSSHFVRTNCWRQSTAFSYEGMISGARMLRRVRGSCGPS
jgi:CheY-like chemotaxis protein